MMREPTGRLPRCTLRLKISEAGLLRYVLNRSMEDVQRRIRVLRGEQADAGIKQDLHNSVALLAELEALRARLTQAINKVCGL